MTISHREISSANIGLAIWRLKCHYETFVQSRNSLNKNMKDMKYLLTSALILSFLFCSGQKTNTAPKKINIKIHKDLPLHPGVIDDPKSSHHIYLYDSKIIEYSEYNGNVSIQESLNNSPYTSVNMYSLKTLRLLRQQQMFYGFCIGTTNIYNAKGIQIETIDCDKNYKFSVPELIKKILVQYKIDLTNVKGKRIVVDRGLSNQKYCYYLYLGLTENAKGPSRHLIIDGNTGETISDEIQHYNSKGDPTI